MPRGAGGGEWARLELTEPLIKNVILPGKLSILCEPQNKPTIVRKYRATRNFLQICFLTLLHNANRLKLTSIMKFNTRGLLFTFKRRFIF